MRKLMLYMINLYQKIPFSSHNMCRFVPSCSNYFKEALNTHGVIKGSWLGFKRILRCHPLGRFGYDPVPQNKEIFYEEN